MSSARNSLSEEILLQLRALVSYQRRAFCAQPIYREVSLPQLHILMTLQECGRMTVSAMAQLLRVSTPSASSIVDRMEEHGLVRRARDAADRRVVHVEISEYGRGVVEELSGLKREQMHRLLGTMTGDELEDVLRGMQALRRALARDAGPPQEDEVPAVLAERREVG